MLTHRTRATTTAAIAAVLATVIALLAVIAYQGAAAADGQPPPAPQNPMAHLIAGDGQEPQVRVSWDAPAQGTAASHTVSRNDGENFEVPERGDHLLGPGHRPRNSLLLHRDSRERGGLKPRIGFGDSLGPAGPIDSRQPRRHRGGTPSRRRDRHRHPDLDGLDGPRSRQLRDRIPADRIHHRPLRRRPGNRTRDRRRRRHVVHRQRRRLQHRLHLPGHSPERHRRQPSLRNPGRTYSRNPCSHPRGSAHPSPTPSTAASRCHGPRQARERS